MRGNYAKSLRTYLGISLKDLAKLANVSPKSVTLLESNQPLQLEDKIRILAQLYKRKAVNFA